MTWTKAQKKDEGTKSGGKEESTEKEKRERKNDALAISVVVREQA